MNKWILVSSHRRSGTHFLIDSLQANLKDSIFPAHRRLPKDFNIGSLLRKDETIYEVVKKLLSADTWVIIKSHLLPDETRIITPKDKYEEFVSYIYAHAFKLYVYRNGRDTLVSLYHFLNKSDFKQFLREQNDHFACTRSFDDSIDANRVTYWSYHVHSWLNEENVCSIRFEDLKDDFSETMGKVIASLGQTPPDRLTKPELPKNRATHYLQLMLFKQGLLNKVKSTSVRPRRGRIGDSSSHFDDEDEKYFLENSRLFQQHS